MNSTYARGAWRDFVLGVFSKFSKIWLEILTSLFVPRETYILGYAGTICYTEETQRRIKQPWISTLQVRFRQRTGD